MLNDLLTPTHLIFLLVLALLIFGPRRLPEIGSGMGKALRDFRMALTRIDLPDRDQAPPASEPPREDESQHR
ncbi:MAG: twin-arginine translocase TatA/TatE family subunit [Bacilli bacterium]